MLSISRSKVTVLLGSIDLQSYVQTFECFIVVSSFHGLLYYEVSIYFHGIQLQKLRYPPNMPGIVLHPIMLAYLTQA